MAERLRQGIANPSLGNWWIGSTPILPAIILTHMRKYYHYSTGRYALVDVYYRNIWLNLTDEMVAHEIRTAFLSKAGMIVYDLTYFKNWTESTVDSDCCLGWKIPLTTNENATALTLSNRSMFETQKQHISDLLINEPAMSLLTCNRQIELQHQMMLYKKLLEETKLLKDLPLEDSWWRADYHSDPNTLRKELLTELHNIFATEIHIEELEKELYQYAKSISNKDFSVSSIILKNINRIYA